MISAVHRGLMWVFLSMPALYMIWSVISGQALLMDQLNLSGQLSIKLMILALLPGPLADYFGRNPLFRLWLSIRRNLGVAAFAYATLHLIFYLFDMRQFSAIIDELGLTGIWSGWVAFILLVPPALISFNYAVKRLGQNWKRIQKLVYAAFAVGVIHWIILGWSWLPILVHLTPLLLAWYLRFQSQGSIKNN